MGWFLAARGWRRWHWAHYVLLDGRARAACGASIVAGSAEVDELGEGAEVCVRCAGADRRRPRYIAYGPGGPLGEHATLEAAADAVGGAAGEGEALRTRYYGGGTRHVHVARTGAWVGAVYVVR